MFKSTKENTLFLTTKSTCFDLIVKGVKKEESREVRENTWKQFLATDKDGFFYLDPQIRFVDPMNVLAYNNGNFPYLPKDYDYLELAVGESDLADTALIVVKDITFEVAKDKEGKDLRYDWDEVNGYILDADNGRLAAWHIIYHLGNVVEVVRHQAHA